ncbi:BCD family MFS transporter [Aurantimonas sp. VKM B-3413]|uniref:BCD family MFS transporter n=1 Tax=Aurantimonas sp. VKM B-3413 TaxID=2779401 RepID=UPI001E5BF269|nr:BCD family MFS transporter [Aurantimonas sp. VKM B-3413]MCB8837981.1 BCD family MFS transporter [Aurantimonas sp. VKM B-3413]
MARGLTWFDILRLALVQTALGAMVVLTTSTMNRIMVVELALPAMLPGALVGLHYAVQMLRPRFGHGADGGRRRTPFIVGGMAVLALGATGAAVATALMGADPALGMAAATLAFLLIGVGVGAAGTNLLTLVATHVSENRRAPAATLIWIMMIAGFALTTGLAGGFLDPYSPQRLIAVTGTVCAAALLISIVAITGIERRAAPVSAAAGTAPKPAFETALAEVWREATARRFTIFIFVSMLAYSAQDLVLEPFAGLVFHMTPGETTLLSSAQHGGVLAGMILVALAGGLLSKRLPGLLRALCVLGCLGAAATLAALAVSGSYASGFPLTETVFALGLFNGIFAVSAISAMMALAGEGGKAREGVRMGLWGAAQAIAFGLGGFLGTVAVDAAGRLISSAAAAYGSVFAVEAVLFLVSGWLALRAVGAGRQPRFAPAEMRTDDPSNLAVPA